MKRLLTSCFGLGFLPGAPGTFGSLPPAIVFLVLSYFSMPAVFLLIVLLALVFAGSFVCIRYSPFVTERAGKQDPREIVADEFAGQAMTFLLILPFLSRIEGGVSVCVISIAGFGLFRLFDIFKPFPVGRLERVSGGWGILADDLAAGVYAGFCLAIFILSGLSGYLSELICGAAAGTLNVFTAALLGIVQGITEFLPVSSSGHLVLLEHLFGFNAEGPAMLLFDLTVHTATAAAIFAVFYKSIAALLKDILNFGKYGKSPVEIYKKSPSVHIFTLAVITTFVTGVLGFLFEDYLKAARGSLLVVVLMWVITGTVLIITDFRRKTRVGLRQFGITAAVIVGAAQAVAILPGISRSGATISAAILLGLHRRWAVEYSFLIAIPAILGAAAISLIRDFDQIGAGGLSVRAMISGFVMAFVFGVFALKLLMAVSRRARLKYFAFYCYLLAFFVLIYCLKQ